MAHDMKADRHAKAVGLLFDKAIGPTCTLLATEVEKREGAHDRDGVARWREARSTQMIAHQSFALTMGALWEREFQEYMLACAAVIPEDADERKKLAKIIKVGSWDGLIRAFEHVRGFSLEHFPSYRLLRRLHQVTSAVRHGLGRSAEELYAADPGLFASSRLVTNWADYFTESVDRASVSRLDLKVAHLEGFRDGLAAFWEMIAYLSRNSELADRR